MKSSIDRSIFSHLVVLTLTLSIITTHSLFAFSITDTRSASGEIKVTGAVKTGERPFVLVNGEPAFTGRTFFSGAAISTPDTSSASIDFGKLGRVELGPGSSLSLSASETKISGLLSAGRIEVSAAEGVAVEIITPDDTLRAEGSTSSHFNVNVVSGASTASVENGIVHRGNGVAVAKQDDDDDDDDGNYWIPVIVIGGTIATVFLVTALEDDDEIVSPIR